MAGRRYQLGTPIGQGGMGVVYRAKDRLTGAVVALKQMTAPHDGSPDSSGGDFRYALAQEFRVLASLRHPAIISVLDYGFDGGSARPQPYFTMDLLDDARTFLDATHDQPPRVKAALLLQVAQALAYLHQRGVLHRDLKPANVLVIRDPATGALQAKVLDFGLAKLREQTTGEEDQIAGTLSYLAPEVLMGSPPSESSDLYALGVMGYELFAGRHPFTTYPNLLSSILNDTPDLSLLDADPTVGAVIGRLLAKTPQERFRSAREVISALTESADGAASTITRAIRESFLQAARFVGREREMISLTDALNEARERRGSAWLIGGESGVGKSRLLDELRVWALVRGVWVLRGQAVSEGGEPYHVWVEALRWMCVQTDIRPEEAAYFKPFIDDVDVLMGQPVGDPPESDPAALAERMQQIVEEVLLRQPNPMLLILEDFHWESPESLAVLQRMTRRIADMPLVMVVSFRDDERPDLPAELPQMRLFRLRRLATDGIAALAESMIGAAGREPAVIELIEKETEGNAFFMVEVVRALAEEAGDLDRIAHMTLPQRVLAGGVQRIIRRRLERVPRSVQKFLRYAALSGRYLDVELMREAMKRMPIDPAKAAEIARHGVTAPAEMDDLLHLCAEAAILDVEGDRWRFAHDKLREALIADLDADQRRSMHAEIARAIETLYPNAPDRAAALAFHWGLAGDQNREAAYARIAGDVAFRVHANRDAVTHYRRAVEIATQSRDSVAVEGLTHLYLRLGRALELTNRYPEAVQMYDAMRDAASHRGDRAMELAAMAAQLVILSIPSAALDVDRSRALGAEALDLARALADRATEAKVLWSLSLVHAMGMGDFHTSVSYAEGSLAIARELNLREQLAYTLNDVTRAYMFTGQFQQALDAAAEANALWREQDNLPMLTDNLGTMVIGQYYLGQFREALASAREARQISDAIDNGWGRAFSMSMVGALHFELGQIDQAIAGSLECIRLSEQVDYLAALVTAPALLGVIYGHLGQIDHGIALANQSLHTAETRFPRQRVIARSALAHLHVMNGDLDAGRQTLKWCMADMDAGLLSTAVGPTTVLLYPAAADYALITGDNSSLNRITASVQDFHTMLTGYTNSVVILDRIHRGRVALASGDLDAAGDYFDAARADAESTGAAMRLWPALGWLAEVELRRGNHPAAAQWRDQARAVIDAIAQTIPTPELQASFLRQPAVRAALGEGSS
jgi:tetratricopeptide (TPR) repeat protein